MACCVKSDIIITPVPYISAVVHAPEAPTVPSQYDPSVEALHLQQLSMKHKPSKGSTSLASVADSGKTGKQGVTCLRGHHQIIRNIKRDYFVLFVKTESFDLPESNLPVVKTGYLNAFVRYSRDQMAAVVEEFIASGQAPLVSASAASSTGTGGCIVIASQRLQTSQLRLPLAMYAWCD